MCSHANVNLFATWVNSLNSGRFLGSFRYGCRAILGILKGGRRFRELPIGFLVVAFGITLYYRILNINHKTELLRSLWVPV